MRQTIIYTDGQLKAMDAFFNFCCIKKVNFEDYKDICALAELFREKYNTSCTIALLAFSALIRYRNDKIEDIIERDINCDSRVRLPTIEFVKEGST